MAVYKFLLPLLASYILLIVNSQNQSLYINFLNCTISEKFIFPNVTCSAKSYNRSFSGLNIIGTSRVPLNNISVNLNWNSDLARPLQVFFQGDVRLLYRYGNVYREVIHTPTFDLCAAISKGTDNIIIKQLIDFIDNADLIHDCPYNVIFETKLWN